jgi:GT2 family glycosyltransferase
MIPAVSQPAVSVLVPTVGRPRLLARALASVRAQTFTDFEVHVLNDGGPSVRRVVDNLRDSRFILREFPLNRGKAAVINHGLREAAGRYIAYLDDDDEYLPEHLSVLLEALAAHPETRWAYADTLIRYHRPESRSRAAVFTEIENEADVNFPMLYWGNRINHKNAIHERSLVLEVGGYDETATFYIDWEIFLKMAFVCRPHHVRRVTSLYYRPLFAIANKTFEAHRDAEATARREHAVRRGCVTPISRGGPLVSLLVAEGDNPRTLAATVVSGVEHGCHLPLEVVLPCNAGMELAHRQLDALSIPWRTAATEGQSATQAFNTMASTARGDVLALIRPAHTLLPGWLKAALALLERPNTGLVGSLDLDGSGSWTRRAGVAAGPDGVPELVGTGWLSTDSRLHQDMRVPAVAAWATCVTRNTFEATGGFNPRLPEIVAAVDLSLRLSDLGFSHYCSVHTPACEMVPGTNAWPMLPMAAFDSHRGVWQERTTWTPIARTSTQPVGPDWTSAERPYRVIDGDALCRSVARARRVLLFGTARVEHVEAIAREIRAGAPATEIGLFAHAGAANRLMATGLFHRVFAFHSHRVHLSLLPGDLVTAVSREHYEFAMVAMNSLELTDYGHVFALARLAGAPPRFAVTQSFAILALDDRRLRQLRGAWYGRAFHDRRTRRSAYVA